ncbi:MAG TPA: hypothetical protein VLA51_05825, partial [Paracoccaceae bacterium]|nr:hypothetical protein [Paracoccaceae bacterium]
MSEFALKGAELKKSLNFARKGPVAFSFNPGKSEDETFFGLHRVKAPKILGKAAKDEGPGNKYSFGTALLEGKELRLTPERELPMMAKQLKRYLKSQKIALNVVILDQNGNLLESDVEEDLPDDPDMGEDGDSAPSGDGGDDPAGDPDDDAGPDEDAPDPLAARWLEMEGKLTPVVANAASKALADPTRLRAAWAMAQEAGKTGKYATALQIGAKIVELIKAGDGAGHAAADTTDINVAKWGVAKAKMEPFVAQALKNGAGDVGKIRAVWDFALGKAEIPDYPAALQSLTMLATLLAAAKQAGGKGPDEIPAGVAKARSDEIGAGKELLAELRGLLDPIKAALSLLPAKGDAVRADIVAVQSAVSTNDSTEAQSGLKRIKDVIDEADVLRAEIVRRRDLALIALQALSSSPEGTNDSEKALHNGQRQAAQRVLDVEFPPLASLDTAEAAIKLLGDLITVTKMRLAQAVRRKEALTTALQTLTDPEGATEAENATHATKRKAVTDQVQDSYPTDENLTLGEAALKELRDLLAVTTARITETKRRRAEVEAAHKAIEADIAYVLALEGTTETALKLQRKLRFQEGQFAKLMADDGFDKAEALIGEIKTTIAALKAEEVEIEKAKVLRDKLLAEYKALEPTLKKARAMYEVSADFSADFKNFSDLEYWVGAGIKDRKYASTFPNLDRLKAVAEKLIGRKAEFDLAAQQMILARQKLLEAEGKKAGIDRFNPLLPDLKRDCDAFKTELSAAIKANKDLDLKACIAHSDEALRLSAAILARNAENLAESAKRVTTRERLVAVLAKFGTALSIERVDPAFKLLMETYVVNRDAALAAFNTEKDSAKCLALVEQMETQAAELAAKKAANAEAIAKKAAANTEYQKVSGELNRALKKIKVYTPEGLAAKTAFDAAYELFFTAYSAGASDVLDKMNAAVAKAKTLNDMELAEMAQRGAAKKAMDGALAAFLPKYKQATALAQQNRPTLDADNSALGSLADTYNKTSKASRYFEATEALAKASVIVDRMLAAKATAEQASALLKPQFEAKWTTQLKVDIATVLAFNDVMLPDLRDRMGKVFAHDAKIKNLETSGRWHDAIAEIDALTPVLQGLLAQKGLIDQKTADSKWLNEEYPKDKGDLEIAKAINGATRELSVAVGEFQSLSSKFFALKGAHEYTQARAMYPERIAAAKALVLMKAQYDTVQAKYEAANNAWNLINADHDAASKYKAINPELTTLIAAFQQSVSRFGNAYFGFDYDAA